MSVDDRLHREPPGPGVRRARRPVDVEQPAPAVLGDKVLDERVRARPVVRGHHVHAALRHVTRHDHHGDPLGQPGHHLRRDHALTDQQAVHLARERQQAGLHWPVRRHRGAAVLVLAQEGDQQGPGKLPDPRLDPAHHLVVEQQAHRLDVVLVRLEPDVLHADKADHVLAVPCEGLGRAVGHVAELLDRRAHPGPGGFPHGLLPVQDPGDGGDGNPRLGRNVIERNQAVTCLTCKRLQAAM